MYDFKEICTESNSSIINVVELLDKTSKRIILIVEEDGKLLGIVSDGDIRRWILKNGDLMAPVSKIMNTNPIAVKDNTRYTAYEVMKKKLISAIPVLDDSGVVIDVVFWSDHSDERIRKYNQLDVPVVIMAGGKGKRLYPYTKILPKPLVPIGDMPIVERIINRFIKYGASEFIMTVNYKKNMIMSYFADIDREYKLSFVEESFPMGTGGSLSLVKDRMNSTFILTNCDILIDADYAEVMDFHKNSRNKITILTSLKTFTIPYGVVRIDTSGEVTEMFEKPKHNYLINTGVYIVEPDVLKYIPDNSFFHFTELIDKCMELNIQVGTYPVSEKSWHDMGQIDEMQRMLNLLDVNGNNKL